MYLYIEWYMARQVVVKNNIKNMCFDDIGNYVFTYRRRSRQSNSVANTIGRVYVSIIDFIFILLYFFPTLISYDLGISTRDKEV
jgi:hypothetical protein